MDYAIGMSQSGALELHEQTAAQAHADRDRRRAQQLAEAIESAWQVYKFMRGHSGDGGRTAEEALKVLLLEQHDLSRTALPREETNHIISHVQSVNPSELERGAPDVR